MSITFIKLSSLWEIKENLFTFSLNEIRFESCNRKWNGVPNSHPNSSKRLFHCFNLFVFRQSHMYNYFLY